MFSVITVLGRSFPEQPRPDVEDAAQEAALEFLESAPLHIRESGAASARWMQTVARRRMIDVMRHEQHFIRIPYDTAPGGDDEDPWEDFSPTESSCVEDRLTVEQLLSTLPPNSEELVRQHYLEGYSIKEIAQKQQCSLDAAKKRHIRAIDRLRKAAGELRHCSMCRRMTRKK